MKYRQLLLAGEEKLKNAGIDDAKNDAWLLFEYISKMPRHQYFMKMNDDCKDERLINRYEEFVDKRSKHVPLQHITGTQDFFGLTFKVNENVLIPRQDTEILVEKALSAIKEILDIKSANNINVLDMCTGSGCIAITIEKNSGVNVTAVDISEKALEVAISNKENLGSKNVSFVKSNLFEKLSDNTTSNICKKYDIIVSNPPYIRSEEVDRLMPEVKDFEPRLALDGTEDGLLFYRNITKASTEYIIKGGWLMYEIGCDQGIDVKNIMEEAGYKEVAIYKDLAGLDRVVVGKYSL